MKKCLVVSTLAVLLLPICLYAADPTVTKSGLFWLGGHYTSISDYSRKVGEFNLGEDQFMPEFMLNYQAVVQRARLASMATSTIIRISWAWSM